MNLKSVIDLQMILTIPYWGARLNFMFLLLQLHTKSLCVLALQNLQFEASTSSRPQTVYFEALGHKAIILRNLGLTESYSPFPYFPDFTNILRISVENLHITQVGGPACQPISRRLWSVQPPMIVSSRIKIAALRRIRLLTALSI